MHQSFYRLSAGQNTEEFQRMFLWVFLWVFCDVRTFGQKRRRIAPRHRRPCSGRCKGVRWLVCRVAAPPVNEDALTSGTGCVRISDFKMSASREMHCWIAPSYFRVKLGHTACVASVRVGVCIRCSIALRALAPLSIELIQGQHKSEHNRLVILQNSDWVSL